MSTRNIKILKSAIIAAATGMAAGTFVLEGITLREMHSGNVPGAIGSLIVAAALAVAVCLILRISDACEEELENRKKRRKHHVR